MKTTMTRKPKANQQTAPLATIPLPALKDGECWAGIVLNDEGAPSHHLILLPGQAESVTWSQAKAWAKKAGGQLPTRSEQALLYANLKKEFQGTWYWSSEPHASDADWAWVQGFDDGSQGDGHKDDRYRARAVRRIKI